MWESDVVRQEAQRYVQSLSRPTWDLTDNHQWRGGQILGQGGDGAAILWYRVDENNTVVDTRVEKIVTNAWRDPLCWATGQTCHTPGGATKEIVALQCLGTAQTKVITRFMAAVINRSTEVVHIWQEYCTAGDLSEIIKLYATVPEMGEVDRVIPEKFIWFCFEQMAQACLEMETSTRARVGARTQRDEVIVHQDLKPNNVFVTAPERRFDQTYTSGFGVYPSIRMGDFGRAILTYKYAPDNPEVFREYLHSLGFSPPELYFTNDEISTAYNLGEIYPSPRHQHYIPFNENQQAWPEFIGSPTNIYQIGTIVLCLMETRFNVNDCRFFDMDNGGAMQEPEVDTERTTRYYSPELRDVVRRCLLWEAETRLTPSQLLEEIRRNVERFGLDRVGPEEVVISTRTAGYAVGMMGSPRPMADSRQMNLG